MVLSTKTDFVDVTNTLYIENIILHAAVNEKLGYLL